MIDWTSTMQQTFEYYVVDPDTWTEVQKIDTVISSSVSRDLEAETLGSASISIGEHISECYIRIYLVVIQNDIRRKFPLGTYMVQTPRYSFDGKVKSITLDAYTPLIELKEKHPPIGYSLSTGNNILETAILILREQIRAPIVVTEMSDILYTNFVANLDDTWMTFLTDLIANANMYLDLDEMGRVIFSPMQDIAALQPVWTFDTSNSSILYPNFDIEHDLYGIPNEVEVIYSTGLASKSIKVVNDNPNSPVSTVSRGRRITHRITNPEILGNPTDEQLEEYARRTLKSLSSIQYTVSYKHGYCPVRIGDCVRLNYESAGLKNVKAKVISQSIECVPGCPVTEKAVFTNDLWEGDTL